ncbi:MAG: YdgH/BhsA/McbA-like domain containing protein, partial [Enterobacteriaceae bacterium]
LVPFDTVSVSGFFGSQPNINAAIARLAQEKGAASFAIVRQIDTNGKGGTIKATAFIYKADAPKRAIQDPNAIPADSIAGQEALAKGGEAAKQVEIPGLASSSTVGVGRFFETQTSEGGRYAVTLDDGTRIEELNNATAAQMAPFDSITFTGHFSSVTDMSYQVAKRAAAKGAKFYHITRQWQNGKGGNLTVSADLFK